MKKISRLDFNKNKIIINKNTFHYTQCSFQTKTGVN